MTGRLRTLMARATHYKPMLPNGIGSEPWLRLRGRWSFTNVVVEAIAPIGRREYDVFYRRGETPCRMFVRVSGPEQLSLFEGAQASPQRKVA